VVPAMPEVSKSSKIDMSALAARRVPTTLWKVIEQMFDARD